MRYRRAVDKLRTLAEACESVKDWPPEDPFLLEAHVFGEVLEGADPLESVEVALVINLPPEEVPWESSPHGTVWLADRLRLDKGGFAYCWRSHLGTVPNHHIREPVRFWSQDGPDEAVLRALAERRFRDLARLAPSPQAGREQLAGELGMEWTAQQARNLLMDLGEQAHRAKFMIRDRGSNFTAAFDAVLADAGIRIVLCNVRTPRMNAIAERWIGGCRRGLLDRALIWNQSHLRRILRQYETHHNQHRPHRSLNAAAPLKPLPEPVDLEQYRVRRQTRVGGTISEYRLVK